MAGNQQEELSMEEILSSIRNILTDEDGGFDSQNKLDDEVEETVEEIEDLSAADSVFNLSKEMVVEEKSPIEYSPIVASADSVDIDPITDIDALIGIDDISIDDIKLDIDENPLTTHDESLIMEDEDNSLEENLEDDLQAKLDDSTDVELSNMIEENLEEDFVESEEDIEDIMQIQLEQNTLGQADDALEEELKEASDEDLMPSFNDIKADTVSEPIYVDNEPAPQIEEETVEAQEQVLTPDASEKILNKFAQIFEEDKQRKIIEDVAREEIAAKTQAWLDENLKTIVVDLVQKEVERVMAKVGK